MLFVLPVLGGLLLHKYGGMEKLSAFMVMLFAVWAFEIARTWNKATKSGITVRLGRSRFQRLYLVLAAVMLLTQIPNWVLNGPSSRLAGYAVLPVMLGIMALLPNFLSGAGVYLNGSLLSWGKLRGATWRAAPEPLLVHTKGFMGTGQLPVPVSEAQRNEVESILARALPRANYSPIAGS